MVSVLFSKICSECRRDCYPIYTNLVQFEIGLGNVSKWSMNTTELCLSHLESGSVSRSQSSSVWHNSVFFTFKEMFLLFPN